jgi:hypothetical protein
MNDESMIHIDKTNAWLSPSCNLRKSFKDCIGDFKA